MRTLINMILVIVAFNLVSCGKSEKEKCEEKGAPWKWDAEQKRCVNPSSSGGGTEEAPQPTSTDTGQTSLKLAPDEYTFTRYQGSPGSPIEMKVAKVSYQHGIEMPDFESTPGIILEPAISEYSPTTPAANGAGCVIIKRSQIRPGVYPSILIKAAHVSESLNDVFLSAINNYEKRHWSIDGWGDVISTDTTPTACAHRLE